MLVFEEGGKPENPEKNLANKPGTHWWEASALTTVLPLLPALCLSEWHSSLKLDSKRLHG